MGTSTSVIWAATTHLNTCDLSFRLRQVDTHTKNPKAVLRGVENPLKVGSTFCRNLTPPLIICTHYILHADYVCSRRGRDSGSPAPCFAILHDHEISHEIHDSQNFVFRVFRVSCFEKVARSSIMIVAHAPEVLKHEF